MSTFDRSPKGRVAQQQPRSGSSGARGSSTSDAVDEPPRDCDPHLAWLKQWRCLRIELSEGKAHGALVELQRSIADTPAGTLAGLQAQAELIAELAWNELVAATARQLIAGLKRLQEKAPT